MRKTTPLVIITVLISCLLGACAGTDIATAPGLEAMGSSTFPDSSVHCLLGVWEVSLDVGGAMVVDITRDLAMPPHFNVKKFLKPPHCDDCLTFSNVVDDPVNQILSADVTIKNPTMMQAADIRGIVMSNNPDIYLTNPDDYITLYDPDDPPDTNPFRLFGKDLPRGILNPGMMVTEHFDLHYDQLPCLFRTAVDAIYPPLERREPYAILNQTIGGALDVSGMVVRKIELDVLDRHDDAGAVSVTSEELGLDTVLTPDPGQENHYFVWVQNTENKPAGDYTALISASDQVSHEILYDYMTITVSETLGEWQISEHSFPNTGCPRDIAVGYDPATAVPTAYFPGGSECREIRAIDLDFSAEEMYFELTDIDPLVPGFSPYPVKRLDLSYAGGTGFFTESGDVYDDPFYTGPVSSLMLSLYIDMQGDPCYVNPGDGDAGRMYPPDPDLRVVDVTDGMMSELVGLWADPGGVIPPVIYALSPDYTRHDVFMGGSFPSELLGDGEGKISPHAERLRALDISALGADSGLLFVLESDGSTSELEVINFWVDLIGMTTTFESATTVPLGSCEAVDLAIMMYNISYLPNPDSDTIVVLVQGSSGGLLKMYDSMDFSLVEEIGSDSDPAIPGTAAALDIDNAMTQLVVINEEDTAVVFSWVV